jgi:hypothetical protein
MESRRPATLPDEASSAEIESAGDLMDGTESLRFYSALIGMAVIATHWLWAALLL